MKRITFFLTLILFVMVINGSAQNNNLWNGKKCAVVLTYDDALNVHLDNVIPCLDSAGFKGTFYVIGESEVLSKRLQDWRKAAANGHELGNHTLTHPCDGSMPGRSWVNDENNLSKFSYHRVVNEIKITNTLLNAIDGKTERSFAYPCGDMIVDSVYYYQEFEKVFPGARGIKGGLESLTSVNLHDIKCFFIANHSAEYMTGLVDQAIESNSLLVFLFHGVGGEHSINVSNEAHSALVKYLKKKESEIWVAPLVDVARYIKTVQKPR